MDFGIARAGNSDDDADRLGARARRSISPEQAQGTRVGTGATCTRSASCSTRCTTGRLPFDADTPVAVALKHVNEVPPPAELVPGLPYSLNQEFVLKAMAKDPADRYQSAAEFGRDLRSAREGGPVQAAAFDAGGERTRVMTAGMAGLAGSETAMQTSVLDQAPPARRKKSKWPLILVIVLLAIIAAVAVALWWTMSGSKAAVPSVVGLSKAAAVSAIEKAGFKAGLLEEYSDRVEAGSISRQAPTGGTKLREGGTVDIWVSKGSEKVTLEDMRGWTDDEVDAYLSKNQLVGDRHTGKSNAVADGQVFKQDPPADTGLKRGDTVSYWVSTGKPQITVPDVVDLTQTDATNAITAAGLKLGTVTQQTSTTVVAGSVISQDPAAGKKVDKGALVSIVVSTGSPSPSPSPTPSTSPTTSGIAVPNVLGMDSSTAEQQLTALGLGVAYRQKPNTGQPSGTVVKIQPDAGTVLPAGSTVLLVIAS